MMERVADDAEGCEVLENSLMTILARRKTLSSVLSRTLDTEVEDLTDLT